ncbi:PREDICTED: uncharacterized protein LOC106806128 [Priapulus caudatus]|uniref:Uncharacterized protein LOC106806128 n=1 Tax=Priapulus caudatus TaxID=37621 RepID=A0ABM1DU47_PRICU|nr:PREDICTED: uncharacterized protein LOC106806128 [Priapulus caudatus]
MSTNRKLITQTRKGTAAMKCYSDVSALYPDKRAYGYQRGFPHATDGPKYIANAVTDPYEFTDTPRSKQIAPNVDDVLEPRTKSEKLKVRRKLIRVIHDTHKEMEKLRKQRALLHSGKEALDVRPNIGISRKPSKIGVTVSIATDHANCVNTQYEVSPSGSKSMEWVGFSEELNPLVAASRKCQLTRIYHSKNNKRKMES